MIRGWALALCLALVAAGCGETSIEAKVESGVVRLVGEACNVPILAAGVAVDEHVVVTAAHPIAGSKGDLAVRGAAGVEAPATVVGFDPERDLAVLLTPLTLEAAPLHAAEPGDRGAIVTLSREGDLASSPFEVRREITATGDDIYGEGDVSRRAVELTADVVPGMSGGGVFDEDGRLLGIVFAESRTQSVTYALAASEIEAMLAEVEARVPVEAGRC